MTRISINAKEVWVDKIIPIQRSTDRPNTEWTTVHLRDVPVGWPTDRSTDRQIDGQIDRQTDKPERQHQNLPITLFPKHEHTEEFFLRVANEWAFIIAATSWTSRTERDTNECTTREPPLLYNLHFFTFFAPVYRKNHGFKSRSKSEFFFRFKHWVFRPYLVSRSLILTFLLSISNDCKDGSGLFLFPWEFSSKMLRAPLNVCWFICSGDTGSSSFSAKITLVVPSYIGNKTSYLSLNVNSRIIYL